MHNHMENNDKDEANAAHDDEDADNESDKRCCNRRAFGAVRRYHGVPLNIRHILVQFLQRAEHIRLGIRQEPCGIRDRPAEGKDSDN